MACCRSRLITTRMNAEDCMANSLRKLSNLQRPSPACHCTVTFHTMSSGITMNVIIRSAAARLVMRGRRWEARRRPRPRHTLMRSARLLTAANRKSASVAPTRNCAARVNVGASHSASGGEREEFETFCREMSSSEGEKRELLLGIQLSRSHNLERKTTLFITVFYTYMTVNQIYNYQTYFEALLLIKRLRYCFFFKK